MTDPLDVVRRWWEIWRDGDLDALGDVVAEPFLRHGARGTVRHAAAQVREDMVQFREAMDLAEIRFDAVTVSGDEVWCRVTTMGVNLSTEEPRTVSWLQHCRVVDGRIAEMWWLYALDVDWAR